MANGSRFATSIDTSSLNVHQLKQAVVRHLIVSGVPPNRLAPTGFGEFHPLDDADTEEAYRKNRRIELKFTQR